MKHLPLACAAAALLACSPQAEESAPPAPDAAQAAEPLPAGDYRLDASHASLHFRVSHVGFSFYTGAFTRFDASMTLDPAAPENASLVATVDVSSLEIPAPPAGFRDTLLGPDWFDAQAHPEMRFESERIEMTGEETAIIHGALTLRGATQPVALEARFNGGYPGLEVYDPQARIGFSARGEISRAAFGIDEGLPPPGTTFGVGDEVEIIIETEFTGPPLETAADATTQ